MQGNESKQESLYYRELFTVFRLLLLSISVDNRYNAKESTIDNSSFSNTA